MAVFFLGSIYVESRFIVFSVFEYVFKSKMLDDGSPWFSACPAHADEAFLVPHHTRLKTAGIRGLHERYRLLERLKSKYRGVYYWKYQHSSSFYIATGFIDLFRFINLKQKVYPYYNNTSYTIREPVYFPFKCVCGTNSRVEDVVCHDKLAKSSQSMSNSSFCYRLMFVVSFIGLDELKSEETRHIVNLFFFFPFIQEPH